MFNLPYVPTADGLIDKSFRKGSKIAKAKRSTRKPKEIRLRKSEEARVETIAKAIQSDLKALIKHFPSYEQLPVFYQRLLDIKIDKDHYKKSLGAVQWCLKNIQQLRMETLRDIQRNKDTKLAKEFLGRSASMVKRISGDLDNLIEIKQTLRGFPTVEEVPTLVIAGYANVGKSTFMHNLTGSKVKIASYPFTTQRILIGHKRLRYQRYQIVDSPGLLDRSMKDRNKIELQAILAMKELADVILFLIDPTMDIESQLSLLKEVGEISPRLVVVINKMDIADEGVIEDLEGRLKNPMKISARNPGDCGRVFKEIFG